MLGLPGNSTPLKRRAAKKMELLLVSAYAAYFINGITYQNQTHYPKGLNYWEKSGTLLNTKLEKNYL
jgi:hypothetical protein